MDMVHDIIAEEDRISNLPNEIIHRILSFLDMKYAIQTTTFSKKWKHIWTSMPHLNLNSQNFSTWSKFAKFVDNALSHRNHGTQVSAVELSFRGAPTHFAAVVRSIVNYAYSHNVRKLTLVWFRFDNEVLQLPQSLFSCHTLKHLTLATHCFNGFGLWGPQSAWDFPVLETLNLSNMRFGGQDKTLNLFSKCVNLKDLTLHQCFMNNLDIFNVCAPQLSNLTITDPLLFPKVFNVVAPQLESLTASVLDIYANLLQLSIKKLDSLEEVNLSMRPPSCGKDRFAPGLLDLFHMLCGAKFLTLDKGIIEVLSACLSQLSDEPCPFNSLKCLKQKDVAPRMPTPVRNYLLESSPTATSIMDLRQVPHKRSRQEADNGIVANTLEEEKQEAKIVHEEKRMLEAKLFKQDEVIAEQKAMLEAMKLQHEKVMLEAKIHVQDEVIARQKVMLEATKLVHENGMLEEKLQMQDEVIAKQKAMLETMKLQNEKRMFEAKIQRQDKVIAEQNAMLEEMKLQHEKIVTEPPNIDS